MGITENSYQNLLQLVHGRELTTYQKGLALAELERFKTRILNKNIEAGLREARIARLEDLVKELWPLRAENTELETWKHGITDAWYDESDDMHDFAEKCVAKGLLDWI